MKTLLFKSVILLFVLSSCSTGKSFMHQRYTSYKHKKHTVESAQPREYVAASKAVKPVEQVALQPVAAAVPVAEPVAFKAQQNSEVLTASADSKAILHRAAAPKLLKTASIGNAFASMVKKANDTKTFSKQVKQQNHKHGLLFGVIDAILAIILSVIFVALIVLVVLILI